MAVMTKKGAREVTQTLDRIANLFQSEAALLGVPVKIAHDFALRCDMLADHIERTAASMEKKADYYKGKNETGLSVEPPPADGFDANNIGDEVPGPLEMVDSHEPWMKGEFTQEKFNALRGLQQGGKLGPNVANGLHTKSKAAAGKKSEEEKGEMPAFLKEKGEKGDEDKEAKKAAKKLAALFAKLADDDGDDEGEKKAEEMKEEKAEKQASLSHGFNLTAK